MSSTKRGSERAPLDRYDTPRYVTHRLLEAVELLSGIWYEPMCGSGAVVRAVNEKRTDVSWIVNDIDSTDKGTLEKIPNIIRMTFSDALTLSVPMGVSVNLTNPAFSVSFELLQGLLKSDALTILLQRVNWFEGPRSELFRKIRPSVYALPERVSFKDVTTVVNGKTRRSSQDSVPYGWFVFDGKGRFEVLNSTPAEVRRAEQKERREAERKERTHQLVEVLRDH